MQRAIAGFHHDDGGEWVAELSCGHGQHIRHHPPFWVCAWVLTAEGRAEKLGAELNCVLCDRFEMPAGYSRYKRTPEFDQDSIPGALRKHHSTKPRIWAVIHVIAGRLRYIVEPPLASERILECGVRGIVVPEVLHRVAPEGDVRFFVEFHRANAEPT